MNEEKTDIEVVLNPDPEYQETAKLLAGEKGVSLLIKNPIKEEKAD